MEKSLAPNRRLSNSITDNVLISLRKIIQSIDIQSKHLMKKVGLTGPQLVILQEISKYNEAPIGTIARAISLSQATVTGVLERLEKRALVARRRDVIDRRRVLVRITDDGLQVLETAPPLLQASFVEQFNNLKDWEQSMILSSLQRLVSIMDAKTIKAAPILTTEPLGDTLKSPPSE
ncbi:MAG: MarR family winged helix-turn-helix transcriptional regulator [Desulfobacterales bacterium]|nr:MarR family winged helix-turn-helix transcriptional regulator [Desulfobacterales bacterium]MDJ0912417.1 MarR family winged helix-turn-helix transcriptional regulator [Desulfobacterales bacterium]